jgi:hypothetical protein
VQLGPEFEATAARAIAEQRCHPVVDPDRYHAHAAGFWDAFYSTHEHKCACAYSTPLDPCLTCA